MPLMERNHVALHARASGWGDFFGGWSDQDLELLQRWEIDVAEWPVEPGLLVDWLGCRTELRNYARLEVPEAGGLVVPGIPIPNDTVHADAIEYIAMLSAVERAQSRGGSSFAMLELGASYAPWAVFSALVTQRAGFARIVTTAVEASDSALERIEAHARRNGVWDASGIDFRVRNAAVSVSRKPLYFPKVDTSTDNGAQASDKPAKTDYRGQALQYTRVPGVTLHDLTGDLDVVDFVHFDLQGGEQPVIADKKSLAVLDRKVGCLLLATHSRLIEGHAIAALSGLGWQLYRERPVKFQQSPATSDVVGWTMHDGAQLWLNPRFG